jgi:Acetyltransferase (GNAT) family
MTQGSYPIKRLGPADFEGLLSLFSAFHLAGYQKYFHPHNFDRATAAEICKTSGRDYFCCGWDGETAISYGLLRGFDEGYSDPSLGIATRPDRRRSAHAVNMMHHLHAVAQKSGAQKVRLKVYWNNHAAVALYVSLGYVFGQEIEAGQRIGYCSI